MRRYLLLSSILVLVAITAIAQTERKSIRKGNSAFDDKDFVESEVQYRKALETNAHSYKGKFNLSDAQYKQEKYDETLKTIEDINQSGLSNTQKAMLYHNKGNALFKQQKFQESIDAYKNALKLNPSDNETKYNLSEALRMQKQQQQQDKDNKDNKDNRDNKDNKDDKKKNENKDKQDQNKDQNKDQKDKNQQEQQPKISKEDAERMLQAIQNNEKDIQDRMKEEKAKAAKVRVIKNW